MTQLISSIYRYTCLSSTTSTWHNSTALEIIYTSFIRPVLESCRRGIGQLYTLRNQCSRRIQIEAARIATGATKQVSLEILYQETGWESL